MEGKRSKKRINIIAVDGIFSFDLTQNPVNISKVIVSQAPIHPNLVSSKNEEKSVNALGLFPLQTPPF